MTHDTVLGKLVRQLGRFLPTFSKISLAPVVGLLFLLAPFLSAFIVDNCRRLVTGALLILYTAAYIASSGSSTMHPHSRWGPPRGRPFMPGPFPGARGAPLPHPSYQQQDWHAQVSDVQGLKPSQKEWVIYVGASPRSNTKIVELPVPGLRVSPTPVNPQQPNWKDKFEVDVQGTTLTVRRLRGFNWGQPLELRAWQDPAAVNALPTPAPALGGAPRYADPVAFSRPAARQELVMIDSLHSNTEMLQPGLFGLRQQWAQEPNGFVREIHVHVSGDITHTLRTACDTSRRFTSDVAPQHDYPGTGHDREGTPGSDRSARANRKRQRCCEHDPEAPPGHCCEVHCRGPNWIPKLLECLWRGLQSKYARGPLLKNSGSTIWTLFTNAVALRRPLTLSS